MDYYGSFVFNEEIHTKEYVANVYSVLKLDAVDWWSKRGLSTIRTRVNVLEDGWIRNGSKLSSSTSSSQWLVQSSFLSHHIHTLPLLGKFESEVDKLIFFKQRIRSETSSRARKVSTTKLRKSKRFKRTPNFWYSSRTVPVITKGKEDDEHGERVCTQHMPKIGWSAAGVPARLHWRRTEEASPFNAKLPMQAATIQLLHHRRLTRIVEVRSSRITRRRSEWWTGAYPKAKPVAFVNQTITD